MMPLNKGKLSEPRHSNTAADTHYCAPHRRDMQRTTGSCLSKKELLFIATTYNDTCKPEETIDVATTAGKGKAALHGELTKRFAVACREHGEYCWFQVAPGSVRAAVQENFAPIRPAAWYENESTWLNTYDILLVMKQHERFHTHFKFIGVLPRDFASRVTRRSCVSQNMCDFDVKRDLLDKGKTEFGAVFNHDMHYQQGSHWVALFGSFDPKSKQYGIHYYDSIARKPKPEILRFMKQLATDFARIVAPVGKHLSSHKLGSLTNTLASSSSSDEVLKFKISFNKRQHQFENNECGMFSLNFLVNCLERPDLSYLQIDKLPIDDQHVNMLRRIFYTPNMAKTT